MFPILVSKARPVLVRHELLRILAIGNGTCNSQSQNQALQNDTLKKDQFSNPWVDANSG